MDITASGRLLHSRFVSMGNMSGKTSEEIISAVGQPTSISSMAHGQRLLQWQATGCHMALLFGADDRMIKITHQHLKLQRPSYYSAPVYSEPEGSGVAKVIGIVLGIVVGLGLLISMLNR